MNLYKEIFKLEKYIEEIMESGYSKAEAIRVIEVASLMCLADSINNQSK